MWHWQSFKCPDGQYRIIEVYPGLGLWSEPVEAQGDSSLELARELNRMALDILKHGEFIKPKLTLDDVAKFTWMFTNIFFLETSKGNYLWSDPSYPGGDNTIKPTNQTYGEYCKEGEFGRIKGEHVIKDYCGDEVKIMEE
jgi:hypothetical protein